MSTFDKSAHVLQPHQQRSREALARIVHGAERVLRDNGVDGFSMAAVATASGLPVGNIYRRFRGKTDLLLALKEDVTSRLERAVMSTVGHEFRSLDEFIADFVSAFAKMFAQDETIHRVLFDPRIKTPSMDQIGSSGRRRIFAYYQGKLQQFLPGMAEKEVETLARVSFHIIATGLIAKAAGMDAIVKNLSWRTVTAEYTSAAIGYIMARWPEVTAIDRPAIPKKPLLSKRPARQIRRATRAS
jgi:AcrR family transcriptional regulator